MGTKNRENISSNQLIWFYWDGDISSSRFKILEYSIYSTRVFNNSYTINLVTNSIKTSDLDPRFNINILNWDISFFDNLPISKNIINLYINSNHRDFSDLFRLVLLYKFGGSYIDTDDLCIAPISKTKNIVCRSYDPHTSFYNNVKEKDCIPGHIREVRGWDNINMFPRNDCWQNWNKEHPFILDILTNNKFQKSHSIVSITGDFSWQSIINETCIKWLNRHNIDWTLRLTLLYLFEDFVSVSSSYDKCEHGGELCEIWKKLPNIDMYKWGYYKCEKDIGDYFYKKVCSIYPNLSHLWLHSKDMKSEWLSDIDEGSDYSISTWILNKVKNKINEFR